MIEQQLAFDDCFWEITDLIAAIVNSHPHGRVISVSGNKRTTIVWLGELGVWLGEL